VDAHIEANILDPAQILDVVRSLKEPSPKNNFSVDENLVVTEKDKDFKKKARDSVKSGAMKQLIDQSLKVY
jgi:hypothetical protein